ncbi:MAG: pilus assembly protein PilM, partial [Planctomycetota bacterium]
MANGIFTGIEVGAESVKILSLRRQKEDYIVLGAGLAHLPKDLDEAESPSAAIASIVQRTIRNHKIPVGTTVFGISGKGSLIRYSTLPIVPAWKLAMLVAFEVEEKAGTSAEVAHDYHIIDLPDFTDEEFFVLLAQAHADTVNRQLEVARGSVRRANFLDMRCLAPFNLFAISAQCREEETSLLLDIGAEETGLTLQCGKTLLYSRPLGCGGGKFTGRVAQALNLTQEAAEELKLHGDGILPADQDLLEERERIVSESLKAEASTLCSTIQSSLQFFDSQVRMAGGKGGEALSPERVILTGGGSRLKGLCAFIEGRLQIPCEILDMDQALPQVRKAADVVFSDDQRSHFGAAAGLALSRARPNGFALNLITQQEKDRRRYWDRTVYAYAAGVVAALLLILLVLRSTHEFSVTRQNDKSWRGAIDTAKGKEGEFTAIQAKYDRLSDMVGAMTERKEAGVRVLRGLELLRNVTPPHIFLYEFSTDGAAVADSVEVTVRGRRGRGRSRPSGSSGTPGVAEASGEEIELTGYCLAKEVNQASRLVTEYIEALKAADQGFFVGVKQT